MKERLISAIVFAPVVGFAFHLGGLCFAVLVGLVGFLGAIEYRKLVASIGVDLGLVFVFAASAVAVMGFYQDGAFFIPAFFGGTLVLLTASVVSGNATTAIYSLAGEMYIGGLLGTLALLRTSPDGREWALFALFVTWATDVFAYLGGSLFGKHKLVPKISPSKSVEGALIGVGSAALLSWRLSGLLDLPTCLAVTMGAIVGVLAGLGDLTESLLKRLCKAKDSGNLIPGHGGVLDRFDSLLFTGAGVFIFRLIYETVLRL